MKVTVTNKEGLSHIYFDVIKCYTERPSEGGRTYMELQDGTKFTIPGGWKVVVDWLE